MSRSVSSRRVFSSSEPSSANGVAIAAITPCSLSIGLPLFSCAGRASSGWTQPYVRERVPVGERVGRVEADLADPGDPRLAGHARYDRRMVADRGGFLDPAAELAADDGLVDEV